MDRICAAYRRAMSHARFLLSVERGGRPTTYNHYFNAILQKKRSTRVRDALKQHAQCYSKGDGQYVDVRQIDKYAEDKSNQQQVCEDINDAVSSYYTVARKRFVDAICQQVILHFLLDSDDGPLKVLDSEWVMSLETQQLEIIAGEDTESKEQRQLLEWQVNSLESALTVVRS